jgi:hypothetical protein
MSLTTELLHNYTKLLDYFAVSARHEIIITLSKESFNELKNIIKPETLIDNDTYIFPFDGYLFEIKNKN